MKNNVMPDNLSFNSLSPLTPPIVISKAKKFWWEEATRQDKQLSPSKDIHTSLVYPVPYKELKLAKRKKRLNNVSE